MKVTVPGIPVPNLIISDGDPDGSPGADGSPAGGSNIYARRNMALTPTGSASGRTRVTSTNLPDSPTLLSMRLRRQQSSASMPTTPLDGNRRSARTASASRGSASARRGPVAVDPALVSFYTERPPKLHTPNHIPPITTSDFKATASAPATPTGGHGVHGSVASTGSFHGSMSRSQSPYMGGRPGSPGAVGLGSRVGSAKALCFGHVMPRKRSQRTVPPIPGTAEALSMSHGHSSMRPSTAPYSGSSAATSPNAAAGSPGSRGTRSTSGMAASANGTVGGGAGSASDLPPLLPDSPAGASPGSLDLDLSQWLLPASAVAQHGPAGLFGGEEGGDSVPMLSRTIRGLVHCDLGYAEVTESFEFINAVDIQNLTFRFPVPPHCCLTK